MTSEVPGPGASSATGVGIVVAPSAADGTARSAIIPISAIAVNKAGFARRSKRPAGVLFNFCVIDKAPDLAKGECVGLDTGIEKLDLECVVGDRSGLPD